jgi:hypothetical protein
VFDRVAVLSTTPIATFLTLLFELLLCFGVGEAKEELDTIMFGGDAVIFLDDTLRNITRVKSVLVSGIEDNL